MAKSIKIRRLSWINSIHSMYMLKVIKLKYFTRSDTVIRIFNKLNIFLNTMSVDFSPIMNKTFNILDAHEDTLKQNYPLVPSNQFFWNMCMQQAYPLTR